MNGITDQLKNNKKLIEWYTNLVSNAPKNSNRNISNQKIK